MFEQERMRLPEGAALSADAQHNIAEQLLDPAEPRANVVGFGLGVKWSNAEPTGDASVVVLVRHKVPQEDLVERDRVPDSLEGLPTDVLAVADLVAQSAPAPHARRAAAEADSALLERYRDELAAPPMAPAGPEAGPMALTRRLRPCPAGFSIGNTAITAGTLAGVVYDFLPGASTNPPAIGIGVPARFYVLSNNHVLAASNAAAVGSAIVQPGAFDGGTDPQDRIATLSRFVPIQFDPPVPRNQHRNLVDAAIAECAFTNATREIYFNGAPRAWVRKGGLRAGDLVRKTGRTTNTTFGRVIVTNATVDVNYGGGRVARFLNQVVTTAMSAGGDSGSLVTDLDNNAVGLLFAGSAAATVFNHYEDVRNLLRVDIAERIELQPRR
ncbi:hypothetical protein ACFXPA_48805 [Amycolatopsis sp. NPDC059090]|uniref:hypothetical protein n=1 Tax=Amycolatopsis sp. NPDC059090 TaxID=3346723 RepID=UPI0036716C7C